MTTCWTEIPSLGNIESYLRAIKKFPLLTQEEEANCVHEGEMGKMKLVLSHLRLGAMIARQFSFGHHNFADMIQEANIGLLKAAEVFDPSRARFATVATLYIRAEVAGYSVSTQRIARVATTKAQRKLFFNLNKFRSSMLVDGKRSFTTADIEHIATTLEVKPEEVREMDMRLSGGDVVLDPLIEDEDDGQRAYGNYLGDVAGDPLALMTRAENMWLETEGAEEALAQLNEREQFIIRNRFMIEEPLALIDIAKIFAISIERVRQLQVKALKTMRKHLEEYA